jgi:hypothetical protein
VADLHVIDSGGKTERPTGVVKRQPPREAGAVDQYIDRQTGVQVIGNIPSWNAMHDVKVSVVGGKAVCGQHKA